MSDGYRANCTASDDTDQKCTSVRLTNGQSVGMTLTTEAGFLSMVSVLVLFALIARNVIFYRRTWAPGTWKLLREPTDIYMLTLFIFDLIQALGGVVDIKWIHGSFVHTGPFCTAQGVLQQLGEVGVALATLAITVHTFIVVFWHKGVHSRRAASAVVAIIWIVVILWSSIGPGISKHYEVPSPYWSWIGRQHKIDQILGEYLWLWVTLFTSVLAYVPLFLWSRGNLSRDGWALRLHTAGDVNDADARRAYGMLAYPAVYSVLVIPLSIARFRAFNGHHVPVGVTFTATTLFYLSGFANVLLLLITRPTLLLLQPPQPLEAVQVQIGGGIAMGHVGGDEEGGWDLPSRKSITMSVVSGNTGLHETK
ncbi:hypothetical protein FA95DRAFT_1228378 [Auriscalpium vulgare]|uniref:Uncharacterized protein n=1 Tax=Auriscalpium vulgare TaxID=40419 RepID=A0ACB8RTR4_9AGAM|nr:hypothetical protein FA95DRAFT_1228378 [Auriscalpium vulgare]